MKYWIEPLNRDNWNSILVAPYSNSVVFASIESMSFLSKREQQETTEIPAS